MKIKTQYGELKISENDWGEISITYNTDYEVFIENKCTNRISLHVVEPRTNKILTKPNLKCKISLDS